MTTLWLFFAYLLSFLFGLWWLCFCRRREVCISRSENYFHLRNRLSAYALMQTPCAIVYHPPDSNITFIPSAMLLNEAQHKILLGVLKKAEAKSAVIVVAVIFAIPVLESIVWDAVKCSEISKFLVSLSAGIFTSILIFGVLGAAHLGQPHFRKLSKKFGSSIVGKELQRQLIHDMLCKEAVLHQSIWLGSIALILSGISVLLDSSGLANLHLP